jgi:D-threo-aldose 1-dehydrogenase
MTSSAGALGFGCAELFRLASARERRAVLEAALDAGIAHFDVAPMYGLGAAERELGAFARDHRGAVVVATKFGIRTTPAASALRHVQGPLRRVLEARPGVRARMRSTAAGPGSGRAGALLYAASGYTAAAARAALERSLRALGTDRVDLFLLHDPTIASRLDDVGGFLEWARTEGLIGTWGVAGEWVDAVAVAGRLAPAPPVLQLRDDVLTPPPPIGAARRITFGSLGTAIGAITRHVGRDAAVRERWGEAVGRDVGDPDLLAPLLLRHARLRNPVGVTLFSTTRIPRLHAAAATALGEDPASDAAVAALAALVDAELAAGVAGEALR